MPETRSKKCGIPRPSATKCQSTEMLPSVITSHRLRRKSSSSDAEYSTSSKAAHLKVSKPLKMQGPFRPSIVGKMAKTGEWLVSTRLPKSRMKRSSGPGRHEQQTVEEKHHQRTKGKSKSFSPKDRKPLVDCKPHVHLEDRERTVKREVVLTAFNRQTRAVSQRNMKEIEKENLHLKEKVDSLEQEISDCKNVLRKCSVDPVTLDFLDVDEKAVLDEKSKAMFEVEETRNAMQNILEQNTEMINSLKDMLKGL